MLGILSNRFIGLLIALFVLVSVFHLGARSNGVISGYDHTTLKPSQPKSLESIKGDWQREQVSSGDSPQKPTLPELNLQDVVPTHGNTDAILYVHYDGDPIGRRNIQFFVDHALHSKADFYFIIQGYNVTIEIPEADNIFVIKRENSCYDLGAFGVVLQADDGLVLKKYKRFLLTNSSVRGPFFPNWAYANKEACWSNKFFNVLSDRVKLVGLTVNCDAAVPAKHLQSFALATDQIGMNLILPALQCFSNRHDAIYKGELALTNAILDAGYEAHPLYSQYRQVKQTNAEFWSNCLHADIQVPAGYAGMDAHPFDLMFTKISRIDNDVVKDPMTPLGMVALNRLTEWADASEFSSYEQCG
ncbi:hypothetical protein BCR37DRAFT_206004 [Protomyces lactucae-debilis]|uniref:Uncharacterized protein n=1 Tax=Protomyces lactucae-debilis TaxID=2754530 RepID=A0A1Y2FQ66_PROLT|nr:uncharacterized protein BCR37DRAFT_206004 [Protomyces lactucae-debilis]ORY86142.1 hypothetical protein BCR37DRAFT_206004 [Protomyces lactucae-debilis]